MTIAETLLAARANPDARPAALPQPPPDTPAAYAIQKAIQAQLGPIGGWKVGWSGTHFTCAPLPATHISPSPATIPQSECPDRGVEAEIAVRLATDLPPRPTPYTPDEVLAAIASAHPAIELLQSRYQNVDAVDPLSALADSLSHYGLVYGPPIPNWQSVDLPTENVTVTVDGQDIKHRTGNPAGDMLRLVTFMANEGATWAGGLKAGQFVTTGSWTGKDTIPTDGHVKMTFANCGSVEATYT